jgi:HEAT repeat protein/cyclophilin family peptidyl-prolyl cis-trans isomerase
MAPARTAILLVALTLTARPAWSGPSRPLGTSQAARPQPLAAADIDAIVQLVKLEDTRQFDEAVLGQLLKSAHPEVRRRAVVSIARIVGSSPVASSSPVANPSSVANPSPVGPDLQVGPLHSRGRALLAGMRGESNPDILATVAFATGQLKDPGAVVWLGDQLSGAKTPPAVAFEAARALGKIRTPDARAALAKYLAAAPATSADAVGEALLSIGRFPPPGDIAPIVRWTTSANVEVRWRAAWALFRPRDPAAVTDLLRMTDDKSPEVRFWAVRGLTATVVDQAKLDRAVTSARLRAAVRDPDRRVRTEALRALGGYDDDESFAVMLAALESPDTWLSVSAAEVMGRFTSRQDLVVPRLVAAAAPGKPIALRINALGPLVTLAPDAARAAATALSAEAGTVAKATAAQTLTRLDGPPPLRQGGPRPPLTPPAARTDDEYRQIVERWVVPDYKGAAKPRVRLETPRGPIEIELYAGDAPVGLDYLVKVVESGEIVGTEFGRVVPNFVDQQRAIRGEGTLRDEVNRHGLTRGNLSWASAGLDTGRPGYTLNHTPQPHNEGDFTSLGRVVLGMDAVDRIELGDKITGARMLTK